MLTIEEVGMLMEDVELELPMLEDELLRDDDELLDVDVDMLDELDVETLELLTVLEDRVEVDDMLEVLELTPGAYIAALLGSLQR